jgi:16S rRNA C1402 (ribose-2'-O) methylase RsmI
VEELAPDTEVVLGRELTKTFEEILRLDVGAMIHELSSRGEIKGEATLALWRAPSGTQEESLELRERILKSAKEMVRGGLSRKDAKKAIAELTGISKRRALELVLQATEDR